MQRLYSDNLEFKVRHVLPYINFFLVFLLYKQNLGSTESFFITRFKQTHESETGNKEEEAQRPLSAQRLNITDIPTPGMEV